LAFIEWEPWTAATSEQKIPAPNNFRYLQIRTTSDVVTEASFSYQETAYGPNNTSATPPENAVTNSFAMACFPNPFNPRISIDLDLSSLKSKSLTSEVVIEVFDVRGRKVRVLQRGLLPTGKRHGMTWDGLDDSGRGLPSGIYLVQAKVGNRFARQKITLLR